MREESAESRRPLRSGYTTGACATAGALAAATCLLTGQAHQTMQIHLPKGQRVNFTIEYKNITTASGTTDKQSVQTGIIKDAGDDPDVTHGATVLTTVSLNTAVDIRFFAGEGVGTVTKPGLLLAVGEPAINPVPRQMIRQHLQELANEQHYRGGFDVTIGIENGAQLATKTMNARLGIIGGLSILGTTGIVKPFSCAAYIASIYQGIDVANANGIKHIAACTGSSSETVAQKLLQFPDMAIIEMGDYVNAVVKHLAKVPIPRLTLVAGFGKLCKLAGGHLNLHSSHSVIDFNQLAEIASSLGAAVDIQTRIQQANTSTEVLSLCQQNDIPIAHAIADKACQVVRQKLPVDIALDVVVVDRSGTIV